MADISFGIAGENADFMRALKESQTAVSEATEAMKSSFEGISTAFESITGALGIFSAALAGGAAFKEAINSTVELTTGANALARQFGISATQASDLRVALDDVHVSTETFQAAGNALTKTLNTNEDAFKQVGIATRTSTGEYRNQLDILLDAADKLAKLKEGTDRNVEGQRLFGRAWSEVAPVVKLTSEAMREAGEKAAALGLEVGGEQVSAVAKYRAAMNDVSDVMTGIKNVIGQAVMPALTELGEWFGSIGPGVVEGFRIAIAALELPFRLLWLGIQLIWETGKAAFTQLAQYAETFGAVLVKSVTGDFKGAAEAWRAGMVNIQQIGSDYWQKIVDDSVSAQEKIVNSFATAIVGPKVTPTKAGAGGATDPDGTENRKKLIEQLADYAQDLDTRVTQQHAASIAAITALDEKIANDREREMARQIQLTRDQIRLNDQEAASRLKGISTGLTESERFLQGQQVAAQRFQQQWGGAFRTFQNAFSSAVTNMLRGGQSFGEAMRNVFASIAESALQNAVKNIATMAMQSLAGDAIRSGEIKKDAGAGAAAAYKAVVGIPYVGPILAPIAAGVAYAGILAFESAEGGYDIPGGVNPVVQTHQREMILPEEHADTIRSLSKGGRGGTIHIHGGKSAQFSQDQLADMLKSLGHRFKLV